MDSYRKVRRSSNPYIIENNSRLNLGMLRRFFTVLAEDEAKRARQRARNHRMTKPRRYVNDKKHVGVDEVIEKELHNLHHNIPRQYDDTFGKKGWVGRYYDKYFNVQGGYGTSPKIQNACIEVLNAISFIHAYYVRGCVDYEWYYPYTYQPLAKEMSNYLKLSYDKKIKPYRHRFLTKKAVNNPLSVVEQLMGVCAKPSSGCLGLSTEDQLLMTHKDSPLSKYYPNPTDLRLDGLFAKYSWQKHLVDFIPNVPLSELRKARELKK